MIRSLFLKGKNTDEIKFEYSTLPFEKQRDLWVGKFNNILRANLPEANSRIILKMKSELQKVQNLNELKMNQDLIHLAVSLTEITPESDFYSMMGSLNDYQIINQSFGKQKVEYGVSLSKELYQISKSHQLRIADGSGDTCNCRWTCGDSMSLCTHSECEETSSGCGFLWLQSCKKRDEIVPGECP